MTQQKKQKTSAAFKKGDGKGKQLINYITRESESSKNTSMKPTIRSHLLRFLQLINLIN
jgi:hypothetical protein